MKKLYQAYCHAEEVLCGVLFIAIVTLVFASAFLRQFDHPLIWADDIAKLCFAWVAFFGADVAMRRCRLVGVDIVVNKLSPKTKKAIYIATYIVIALFLLLFVHYGIILSIKSWSRFFQTINVSYTFITLSLPVGALAMLLTSTLRVRKLFANFNDDSWSMVRDARQGDVREDDAD